MILIISYPEEDHTIAVAEQLRQMGRDFAEINLGDMPARRGFSFSWPPAQGTGHLVDGVDGVIDLAQTRAVWWRRVQAFTIDPAITRHDQRIFAESETSQAVIGVLDTLDCAWVNPRGADEAAHRKPLQWSAALACGLNVPRTFVTTKPDDARAFLASLKGARAVYKPFLASIEDWRETRIVEPSDVERLDAVRYAPVLFQEYVSGVDIRVTVIGDRVFAAEIDARKTSYPYDMRMVVGEADVRPVTLPSEVERALLALHRRLGLVYGASDFRRTDDGHYHFFEVNPAGQWLFVEKRTGLQITTAIAEHLAQAANQMSP